MSSSRDGKEEAPSPEEIASVEDVKNLVAKLSQVIAANMQARARSSHDPKSFLASELALDATLDASSILATRLDLLGESSMMEVRRKLVEEIAGLFLHENGDIVKDALGLLIELCDPNSLRDDAEMRANGLRFVDEMMDFGIPQALVQCVKDRNEDDLIEPALTFFSDLCEIYPEAGPLHLSTRTNLFALLFDVLSKTHLPSRVRSTSCELIYELISSKKTLESIAISHARTLLSAADEWSGGAKSPAGLEDEELIDNIYLVLSTLVSLSPITAGIFRESHGLEVVLRAEGYAVPLAVQVLDFATKGSKIDLESSIELKSLGLVFPALAGRFNSEGVSETDTGEQHKRKKVKTRYADADAAHHALSYVFSASILASPSYWTRVVSKFVQDDFRHLKATLAAELERSLDRLDDFIDEDEDEEEEEDEDDGVQRYLKRQSHGLEHVQWIASILGRLIKDDATKQVAEVAKRTFAPHRLAEMRAALVERAAMQEHDDERTNLILFADALKLN